VKLRVDALPELLLPVELFFDAEPAKAVVGVELLLSGDVLFPVFFFGCLLSCRDTPQCHLRPSFAP
jgi:hypothetical protein